MENIIKIFNHHAGKEGDPDTLSQKEFKDLVNDDMPNSFKKEEKDEKAMKDMMDDLEINHDSEMSFDEFVELLKRILIKKHEASHKQAFSRGHEHSPRHGAGIRKYDNGHCNSN
ncbi:protein S100-A9-like [Mus pahari]|uniref:protein S100-A9-like n=1 Tax=Mus pahari TaxID=10093 RepID=UPI000A308700|nr:protein S100-A9-like [Mus pahari]